MNHNKLILELSERFNMEISKYIFMRYWQDKVSINDLADELDIEIETLDSLMDDFNIPKHHIFRM